MTNTVGDEAEDTVRRHFLAENIPVESVVTRHFPGEAIILVVTPPEYLERAVRLANQLDDLVPNGFITVRKSEIAERESAGASVSSLDDPRITLLLDLLSSRSRTSEAQPSLRYIKDVVGNVNAVMAPRHHIIFGRRGVGKTVLMVEAKALLEQDKRLTFWFNLQTLRHYGAPGAFLAIAERLCDLPLKAHGPRAGGTLSARRADQIRDRIVSLHGPDVHVRDVQPVIADLQYCLGILTEETGVGIYIFLDDIHYMRRSELPLLLDMVHSVTRDIPMWIKAAGIRHQCRWYSDDPPTGLQSQHDAQILSLDVTLEEPEKAREFLWTIFRTYVEEAGIKNISRFLSGKATERLVLASGGVPRDFLTLSAAAIQFTRQREKGRVAGVQDVNEAAGRAAEVKLRELEEDAAASLGQAQSQIGALTALRRAIVEQESYTYFRIDLRDKEARPREYDLVQGIMDLRMIHLINSGVSDAHEAGRRFEVYMLDLSQFTGTRFKQRLVVLDFDGGVLVERRTRSTERPFVGDTARKRVQIFRGRPLFELDRLGNLLQEDRADV